MPLHAAASGHAHARRLTSTKYRHHLTNHVCSLHGLVSTQALPLEGRKEEIAPSPPPPPSSLCATVGPVSSHVACAQRQKAELSSRVTAPLSRCTDGDGLTDCYRDHAKYQALFMYHRPGFIVCVRGSVVAATWGMLIAARTALDGTLEPWNQAAHVECPSQS